MLATISSTVGSSLAISGPDIGFRLCQPCSSFWHNDQGAFKIRLDCGTIVAVPRPSSSNRDIRPLDASALRQLALNYVGRYATTRGKLGAYLRRKLAQRGWDGEDEPPVIELVERFAAQGYVDDRAFAEVRAASLARRGYGERRLGDDLKMAGIAEEDIAAIRLDARANALDAALAFARRRRIGPYGERVLDPDQRRRMLGAMLRAGHPIDLARRILAAPPGEAFLSDDAQ